MNNPIKDLQPMTHAEIEQYALVIDAHHAYNKALSTHIKQLNALPFNTSDFRWASLSLLDKGTSQQRLLRSSRIGYSHSHSRMGQHPRPTQLT